MYKLNSDQEAILEKVKAIAASAIAPHAAEVDAEGRFPTEAIEAIRESGLLGLTVSKEFGGMGQGLRTAAAVLDVLAQNCPSTAMIYKMHLSAMACYNSNPETMKPYLEAAAKGEHLTTLAWSEKGSRSQFWAPVSKASKEGENILLNAEKSWVTSAGYADGYVVSTGWADGSSPMESMIYLMLKEDEGWTPGKAWDGIGLRGNSSAPMAIKDVKVPAARSMSVDGKGLDVMLGQVLPVFQICGAAVSVGICEAAFAGTQGHLTGNGFQHLEQKLSDLPNLRARLAQMRLETDRARAHLLMVLDSIENPNEATQLMVLEARASAAETSLLVTETGMRACGGAAFSKHTGLDRYFRDARASSVMAPTTDHVHEFIGRALCGMEVFE